MRVLVVQHVICEGPGLLQEVLDQQGWRFDIRCMDQPGAFLPGGLDAYDAFIILGGPMGAYEEEAYPYLLRVQELVRKAVAIRLPVLGICLGGQLIARALGAHVGPHRVKEIGWYRVRLTPAGRVVPLFTGMPPEFEVFQWHGDTFALPVGAFLLAEGETCANQAFVYGPFARGGYAWALQFHLEVTPEMIEEWARVYGEELEAFGGPGAAEALVRETETRWKRMRPWRERFLRNIEMVLRG
ncbi:MAG: type 1 glutamine amidotransferase [Bacillota bacterium]|nr:type 1 glutamine amidotransferase [Bacillota bacterium]